MTTKTKQYAYQALAASGFVVMSSVVAYRLRPDLWTSGQECSMDFRRFDIEGTQRMTAKLAGVGPVLVLTRSTDMLANRILWITGYQVEELKAEDGEATQQKAPSAISLESKRLASEKRQRLEQLAAQEPPAHDCTLRKDILAARRELESLAA